MPTQNRPVLLAAAAGLAACAAAHAQTLSWINAAGGAASTPGNWNPAQVPGAANPLLFSLNNAYNVSFSGAAPQSSSMTFTRGTVGLSMGSPHTTGSVTLGNGNASSPTVNLTSGTWNTSAFTLGATFGSGGVLNCTGPATLLDCGSLSVAADTNLVSSLNITGSGRVASSSVVIGQNNPIGTGHVTVSGQTRIFPVERSTLDATGTIEVGFDGVGTLAVADGGLVTSSGDMIIARNVSAGPIFSDGTVTVGGLGIILPAAINVGGSLKIGRGSSSLSNTGHGRLTVNDDGVVAVAGSTIVGGSGQGSGLLTVNTGGRFTTAGLTFGTSGDFQHLGGVVTVNGGAFTHDEPTLIVSGAADTSLVLDGLAAAPTFAAPTSADDAVTIGNSGTGSLTLRNGSDLEVALGNLRLGNGAGSSGTLVLESGATLAMAAGSSVVVGDEGPGSMSVRSGSSVVLRSLFVGSGAGAGTVVIENPGTTLQGDASNLRSGGTMTIRDGAAVSFDGNFGQQVPVQSGASLIIDNATLTATTDVHIDGALTMNNGVINARAFSRSVPVSASGTINASIVSGPAITAAGTLSLGDGGLLGFNSADLVVGPHRVDLHDGNTALLRNTTIAGGQLVASTTFTLPAGTTLSGTGTLTGDLRNNGTITASGANGLTFNGVVTGIGQGISGTKLTFTNGGGFSGAGTIAAAVTAQAGSTLTFTAASTLGDGTPTGFVCDGELDVTGGLTINDSNATGLGSLTTLRNAVVRCNPGFNLTRTPTVDVVRGAGALVGNTANAGLISPGIVGGDETSQITITGSYAQQSGVAPGRLDVDLEGTGPADSDLLFVQGPATLTGTLAVSLIHGFQPANGYSAVVVLANSIAGQFTTEILPPQFHAEYSPTQVRVVFCSADFNNDGFVDFFDYDDFVQCFETGLCPPGTSADFNQDGFADFFDYDDFVTAFEQGC